MKLGIFSPEIAANSIKELFSKMKAYGFAQTQFDFLSICDEEMPEIIKDELVNEIVFETGINQIEIKAINATFNMAHSEKKIREDGIKRFEKIAKVAKKLSCEILTLCTGSRSLNSMWENHKDNNSKSAWYDLLITMEKVVEIANNNNIYLGIETEASNICNTPQKVKELILEMQSDKVKAIMDCANLFKAGTAHKSNVIPTMDEAFDVLGEYVVLAHGKDIYEGNEINFTQAGKGIIDFPYFLIKLKEIGYDDGMILHGITSENDISKCINHVLTTMNI